MATREYMLGEHLPDLHITFWVGSPFSHTLGTQMMHLLAICRCTVDWPVQLLDVSSEQALSAVTSVTDGLRSDFCDPRTIPVSAEGCKTGDTAMQDISGNQVEAQEGHHEGLKLSVTGALKEEGEPSQLQELLLDAQVTFMLCGPPNQIYRLVMSLSDSLVL